MDRTQIWLIRLIYLFLYDRDHANQFDQSNLRPISLPVGN